MWRQPKPSHVNVIGWGASNASLPGRPYTFSPLGAVGGLIELSEDAGKMDVQPSWLGYVAVDDVDAATDRIERLGGAVRPPTNVANISRFCVFSDPQAARLALFKWLKPGQARPAGQVTPGRVGWHELSPATGRRRGLSTPSFGWHRADPSSV